MMGRSSDGTNCEANESASLSFVHAELALPDYLIFNFVSIRDLEVDNGTSLDTTPFLFPYYR